jgi:hypothetical protein
MQIKKVDIMIYTNIYKWDGYSIPDASMMYTVEKLDFGEGYTKNKHNTLQSSDYVLITVSCEIIEMIFIPLL